MTLSEADRRLGAVETEPVMAPWEERWRRSQRMQRHVQDLIQVTTRHGQDLLAANTTMLERAQQEYDYCKAVSETPRDQIPPTWEEFFRPA